MRLLFVLLAVFAVVALPDPAKADIIDEPSTYVVPLCFKFANLDKFADYDFYVRHHDKIIKMEQGIVYGPFVGAQVYAQSKKDIRHIVYLKNRTRGEREVNDERIVRVTNIVTIVAVEKNMVDYVIRERILEYKGGRSETVKVKSELDEIGLPEDTQSPDLPVWWLVCGGVLILGLVVMLRLANIDMRF